MARFRVEEVVQQAINSAIHAKATDPVTHVADFLEARGLEFETEAASNAGAASEAAPTEGCEPTEVASSADPTAAER